LEKSSRLWRTDGNQYLKTFERVYGNPIFENCGRGEPHRNF
jgi:hypothetical protein